MSERGSERVGEIAHRVPLAVGQHLEDAPPLDGRPSVAVLLNHPTLTKMIDRMVSDSLLYRRQDANDRRKVLMFISGHGKVLEN